MTGLCFKLKMAAKKGGKDFWQKLPDDSAFALRVRNFVEITLSSIVSEINAFLHFMQKFKMATKNVGKTIFYKVTDDSMYTQNILHHFKDKWIFEFFCK